MGDLTCLLLYQNVINIFFRVYVINQCMMMEDSEDADKGGICIDNIIQYLIANDPNERKYESVLRAIDAMFQPVHDRAQPPSGTNSTSVTNAIAAIDHLLPRGRILRDTTYIINVSSLPKHRGKGTGMQGNWDVARIGSCGY